MFGIHEEAKVYLYIGGTDMRLGIFGLMKLIGNPRPGCIYAFCGKTKKIVKILEVNQLHATLYIRRLFKGKIPWPSGDKVTTETLSLLKSFLETANGIGRIECEKAQSISFY
jgi:hypothetical protein